MTNKAISPLRQRMIEDMTVYTRIATNTIRAVMSPLERLNLKPNKNEPPA
jgi:hypothetical protein